MIDDSYSVRPPKSSSTGVSLKGLSRAKAGSSFLFCGAATISHGIFFSAMTRRVFQLYGERSSACSFIKGTSSKGQPSPGSSLRIHDGDPLAAELVDPPACDPRDTVELPGRRRAAAGQRLKGRQGREDSGVEIELHGLLLPPFLESVEAFAHGRVAGAALSLRREGEILLGDGHAPPHGLEYLVAEAPDHQRREAADTLEIRGCLRLRVRDGGEGVVGDDLERRPVGGLRSQIAHDRQLAQDRLLAARQLTRAADLPEVVGAESL